MREAGFVEGRNFAAEYRYGDGDPTKLPGFAVGLVNRRVDVIITTTEPAVMAAQQATSTMPIVFNYIADPVGKGLVKSITHPGGNITGIGDVPAGAMEAKRLQLLKEAIPAISRVGHLVAEQDADGKRQEIEAVAATGRHLRIEVIPLIVGKVGDLDPVFAAAGRRGVGAVLVGSPSTFLFAQLKPILEAGARHKMPLVSGLGAFAASGGLMQYNVLDPEVPSLTTNYGTRILKGPKPNELPVQQAARFALTVNLKSAKALGLDFSPSLLSTADQVIE